MVVKGAFLWLVGAGEGGFCALWQGVWVIWCAQGLVVECCVDQILDKSYIGSSFSLVSTYRVYYRYLYPVAFECLRAHVIHFCSTACVALCTVWGILLCCSWSFLLGCTALLLTSAQRFYAFLVLDCRKQVSVRNFFKGQGLGSWSLDANTNPDIRLNKFPGRGGGGARI